MLDMSKQIGACQRRCHIGGVGEWRHLIAEVGAGQNRAESETYLKKNRSKPDVIETASGLQYTIKDPGTGKTPDEWSTVEVNQRILLVDGTVLKNTYHGTETDIFTMKEAIDGLKEGLALMKEGGKFLFVVPTNPRVVGQEKVATTRELR